MSYYTHTVNPIGNFIEKEHGNNFEYSLNEDTDDFTLSIVENYPHKVWIGNTVNDNDGPVLERWFLKKNTEYVV